METQCHLFILFLLVSGNLFPNDIKGLPHDLGGLSNVEEKLKSFGLLSLGFLFGLYGLRGMLEYPSVKKSLLISSILFCSVLFF